MEVVKLETKISKYEQDVAECLEELLGRAKKGEFTSFSWTASLKNGSTKTGFTKSPDFHQQLSGVTMLQYRLVSTRTAVEDEDSA